MINMNSGEPSNGNAQAPPTYYESLSTDPPPPSQTATDSFQIQPHQPQEPPPPEYAPPVTRSVASASTYPRLPEEKRVLREASSSGGSSSSSSHSRASYTVRIKQTTNVAPDPHDRHFVHIRLSRLGHSYSLYPSRRNATTLFFRDDPVIFHDPAPPPPGVAVVTPATAAAHAKALAKATHALPWSGFLGETAVDLKPLDVPALALLVELLETRIDKSTEKRLGYTIITLEGIAAGQTRAMQEQMNSGRTCGKRPYPYISILIRVDEVLHACICPYGGLGGCLEARFYRRPLVLLLRPPRRRRRPRRLSRDTNTRPNLLEGYAFGAP
ncbi:uncharacterized protein EV422DRAFT_522172 [Fimicolochytrium jonesii]|uniref:uncharacterized protein n=1 Tax=Fimicolochytrium jonesii TaxID=1396493 RepID=UPI0022FEF8D4|nr:uncharacterized protein EV422DRAFT_522172 [Fimicolochytrium jonesii]KAI8823739.1 hypothetical protein EV422DRAFT_522172 [Fimicolochytrium jonesii]